MDTVYSFSCDCSNSSLPWQAEKYMNVNSDTYNDLFIQMCIRDRAWATREQLGAPYTDTDKDNDDTTAMPSTKLTYGTDRLDFAADSFIFGTSAKDSRYSKLLSTPYESVSYTHLAINGFFSQCIPLSNAFIHAVFGIPFA